MNKGKVDDGWGRYRWTDETIPPPALCPIKNHCFRRCPQLPTVLLSTKDTSPEANSLFLPPSLLFSPFLFPLNISAKPKLQETGQETEAGTVTDAYQ